MKNDREYDEIMRGEFTGRGGFLTSRHVCRKLGFIPATEEVTSAQDLFEFAVRFLGYTEPGKPFDEMTF